MTVPTFAPAILTCALIGGERTRRNPHHPRVFDDVVREGIAAAQAGAAILHIHARDDEGTQTQAPDVYEALARGIHAEAPDVLMNFTTGGIGVPAEERIRSLQASPDLASLNAGSVNFGDEVYENPPAMIEDLAKQMRAAGIKPELECFDSGMVATGAELFARGELSDPPLFQFVLGVRGGAPARVDSLMQMIALLPPGAEWAATAVGRYHFQIMAAVAALGGHLRTGLEDVTFTQRGVFAEGNAQLVNRAKQLCEAVGRPIATPGEARELLLAD